MKILPAHTKPSGVAHSPEIEMPIGTATLDVRGLRCPLPVLRARKAMREVPPGGTLTVLVTDPAAVIDFPHFCHQTGLELLSTEKEGEVLTFRLRKPLEHPGDTAAASG